MHGTALCWIFGNLEALIKLCNLVMDAELTLDELFLAQFLVTQDFFAGNFVYICDISNYVVFFLFV